MTALEFVPRLILFSGLLNQERPDIADRAESVQMVPLSYQGKLRDAINVMHPRFLHRPAIRRGQQEQAYLEFDKQLWLFVHHAN